MYNDDCTLCNDEEEVPGRIDDDDDDDILDNDEDDDDEARFGSTIVYNADGRRTGMAK